MQANLQKIGIEIIQYKWREVVFVNAILSVSWSNAIWLQWYNASMGHVSSVQSVRAAKCGGPTQIMPEYISLLSVWKVRMFYHTFRAHIWAFIQLLSLPVAFVMTYTKLLTEWFAGILVIVQKIMETASTSVVSLSNRHLTWLSNPLFYCVSDHYSAATAVRWISMH